MDSSSLELKGREPEPSGTPRRRLRSSSSSRTRLPELENATETPVNRFKRGRSASYEASYDDVVESEFCRVFSDTSRKAREGERRDGLSFLFRGPTNSIGTSTVGMYGEIVHSGLKLVCKKLVEYGLDERSVVLDLGSGRGVPNFVFAAEAAPFSSIGVEKCPIAYLNSINNMCVLISRDIKRIRSELAETPKRSPKGSGAAHALSPESELESRSDASSSPQPGSAREELDFSPSTQLAEDDCVFSETSATPSRFLTAPRTPHELQLEALQQGLGEFRSRPPSFPVAFVNEDIIAYDAFEGVTHFYSFDIAMERALIKNMVHQFMSTSTAYVFASFISDLLTSFGLEGAFLAAKIPCRMYGSGEGKTCYVYVKKGWRAIKAAADRRLQRALGAPAKGRGAGREPAGPGLERLRFSVNNFDEPLRAIDAIRLSRMPLYYQHLWYLRKLDRFYSSSATRSRSLAENLRESLAAERDLLVEQIARADCHEARRLRQKLRLHISSNFRKLSTFP